MRYVVVLYITSSTGLRELCCFNDEDYHHRIIAVLE